MKYTVMSDVHSKTVRSYNMSRIKGKNTTPEKIVRSYLFSRGLRYRLHDKNLPGKPDIVLRKFKSVVFVHGCFWHLHDNCRYAVMPKTRTEWWREKLLRNKERDIHHLEQLRTMKWKVYIVWECELKKQKEKTLENLYRSVIGC